MTTRQLIKEFIDKYCIKVKPDDSDEYIQKMLKISNIIEYDEIEYYLPDHDFGFTVDDCILGIMLFATYKI